MSAGEFLWLTELIAPRYRPPELMLTPDGRYTNAVKSVALVLGLLEFPIG